MEEFNLIQGNRTDSTVFHHKSSDYIYKKVCEKNDVVYLRCIKKDCPGKARFNMDEVFFSTHDHPGDHLEVQKLILLRRIKERVSSEDLPIQDIFVEECEKAEVPDNLINYKAIVSTLIRHRKKNLQAGDDFDITNLTTLVPMDDADTYETKLVCGSNQLKQEILDEETYESHEDYEPSPSDTHAACPVCDNLYPASRIEYHVDQCLKDSSEIDIDTSPTKRKRKRKYNNSCEVADFVNYNCSKKSPKHTNSREKQKDSWSFLMKNKRTPKQISHQPTEYQTSTTIKQTTKPDNPGSEKTTSEKPLSELIRPNSFDEFLGEESLTGNNSTIRSTILGSRYCSMIFWGPPGCGKTTLANIISHNCITSTSWKFVKMSACTSNVHEVRGAIQAAKTVRTINKMKTIIFMDEIHRFNKAQQDIFLPHIESGLITLIGATTENPSFSLNSALLSRCRVIKLEALSPDNVYQLITRAIDRLGGKIIKKKTTTKKNNCTLVSIDEDNIMSKVVLDDNTEDSQCWFEITDEAVRWLSGGCSGDARVAINALQPLIATIIEAGNEIIAVEHVKDALKDNPTLYDRKGDQHFNHASALQKSIRGNDDNAALYWTVRMLHGGEDPMFIARRLVRTAAEDIGLGDPEALKIAVAAMEATKNIGMPEADVVLCQCAVYLARANKNAEVYNAMNRIKSHLKNHMGELPPVPPQICNPSTKLMRNMGYGEGYSTAPEVIKNISYLPESLRNCNFFINTDINEDED